MLNVANIVRERLTAKNDQLSAIADKLLSSDDIDSNLPTNSDVQPDVGTKRTSGVVHFILQPGL